MWYPRSKHLVIILFGLIILIGILRSFKIIKLNIAHVRYPDINIALYDRDWKGSPYVINEITEYKWYEKSEFNLNKSSNTLINSVLESFQDDFTIDFIYDKNTRYLQISDQKTFVKSDSISLNSVSDIDLCLEKQFLDIIKLKDNLITDVYNVKGNIYVEIHLPMIDRHIHDYEIRLEAPIQMTGLYNDEFLQSEVEEFYIYRSLALLRDKYVN